MENRVRQYRHRLNLTLVQLSEMTGIPVSTLSDIERGTEPGVSSAIRIAKALHVSAERLWPV